MRAEPATSLFPAARLAVPREPGRPVCTLVIDAEESFDWHRPLHGTQYSTRNLHDLSVLHDILDTNGAVPAYLLTYPILMDDDAVHSLRTQLERGRCILGLQLHTWVTPPFDGGSDHHQSYSGNLAAGLEERKLIALLERFIERFGFAPTVFRGGRYGFGPNTARLLEEHGFRIDTSVAPRTDLGADGGPDYGGFDCRPFWFGVRRRLLELPLCRSVVGWGGGGGAAAYRALSAPWARRLSLGSALTRSHCAERVTFSPEGNDVAAMRRLANGLVSRGHPVLALSFHSSSLAIGGNPYVQSKADLHRFYDRLSAILDHLTREQGWRFTDILRVADHLRPPPEACAVG
ncbi:hypothetical protein [Lichenicola sp.]|uniref:hypothetical protein n=1 Tax=Lichenicola sp. TaxID=2804529 RepID=UPI003AFFB587